VRLPASEYVGICAFIGEHVPITGGNSPWLSSYLFLDPNDRGGILDASDDSGIMFRLLPQPVRQK
jgi:hypothetical protein